MAEHLSSEAHFSYSAAANGHEFNHPQAPHTETVSAIGSISLELIGQPERIG